MCDIATLIVPANCNWYQGRIDHLATIVNDYNVSKGDPRCYAKEAFDRMTPAIRANGDAKAEEAFRYLFEKHGLPYVVFQSRD